MLTTTITTRAQPAGQRLDYWNGTISDIFPGIVIDGAKDLRAEWETCRLGDVVVSLARSDRTAIRRWGDARPIEAEGRGKIHLQHRGFSTTAQRGRSATLVAGDLTYCAVDEGYELELSEHNEMFVIDFPLSAFKERVTEPSRVIGHGTPMAGLLHDFLGSIFRQHWSDAVDPEETKALGATIENLIGQCFGAAGTAASQGRGDDRQRVLDFVDANLADSGMRTGQIARALSLPTRAVQTIFAGLATTPTAYIIERRLSLAVQRLRAPSRGTSMTELAHALGFTDAAHFNRRFKARFGVTPGAYSRQYT